ncbi:hypothetical protein C8F01DRAFT_1375332 [Mycena amicta]|nr:hypothetical protein C8F01DRAFT_1375332 [Mycena amicta]
MLTSSIVAVLAFSSVHALSVGLGSSGLTHSLSALPARAINASLIPESCLSTCRPALSAQSTCGTDLKCLCTDSNGNDFAQCIDCVVSSAPATDTLAQSAGEGVIADYTAKCAANGSPIASLSLVFSAAASASASAGAGASPTGIVAQKTGGASAVRGSMGAPVLLLVLTVAIGVT